MELSSVKRVKEVTTVEEANEYLLKGWQIITIYQPEYLKSVCFVLGNSSKDDTKTIFLAQGIKADLYWALGTEKGLPST